MSKKTPKYSYAGPGYDPLQDYLPPRKAGMAGGMAVYGVLVLIVGVGYLIFQFQHQKPPASTALEPTQMTETVTITPATSTPDAWAMTGTAVYFDALTPSPTITATPSPTPSETPTLSPTPLDAWSMTGTAIYFSLLTPSPTITPSATITNTPAPYPTLIPSTPQPTRRAAAQTQPPPHIEQVFVTSEPRVIVEHVFITSEPIIIVQTKEMTRVVVATVSIQSSPTSTLTPVWTATATSSSTPSETPTLTATLTETPTETATSTPEPPTLTPTETQMSIDATQETGP